MGRAAVALAFPSEPMPAPTHRLAPTFDRDDLAGDGASLAAGPRPGFRLAQLVERPTLRMMARLRMAAWRVLDLDTEFVVLDGPDGACG